MDAERFDHIARIFGAGASRRHVVKLLAGGALGAVAGVLGRQEASADCRLVDQRCDAAHACCRGARCTAQGVCTCRPGFTECPNGRCYNLEADERRCGACEDAACAQGETCCGGNCVDTRTSVTHCGRCGRTCPAGETCCGGEFCSCGGTCCADCFLDRGEDPTSEGQRFCCPPRSVCDAGTARLGDDTCCYTAENRNLDERCVNGRCCPTRRACEGRCCPTPCCGGVCCGAGQVCRCGRCRAGDKVCDSAAECCGAETCLPLFDRETFTRGDPVCCSPGRVCLDPIELEGNVCCRFGEYCDTSSGFPACCPVGQPCNTIRFSRFRA